MNAATRIFLNVNKGIASLSRRFIRSVKCRGLSATLKLVIKKLKLQQKLEPQPQRGPFSLQFYSYQDILLRVQELIEKNIINGLIVIDCAFEFDHSRNQTPIALTKAFIKNGYFVFFLRFQWSKEDQVLHDHHLFSDRIYQIPRLEFHNILAESYHLDLIKIKKKQMIVTIPDQVMLEYYLSLRKKNFSIHYHIMDDWEEFAKHGLSPWYDNVIERFFIINADKVTAVSLFLQKKFNAIREIGHVSNGTFHIDNGALKFSKDEHIHVGYFGHLSEKWVNWDFIFKLSCDERFIIHLIGEGINKANQLKVEATDNIHFYGYVKKENLNSYIENFDVCVVPFQLNNISHAADPLKTYEYLQHYRPVVVSGFSIPNYPYCKEASTFEEFKEHILMLYDELPRMKKSIIDEWIKPYYWENLCLTLLPD